MFDVLKGRVKIKTGSKFDSLPLPLPFNTSNKVHVKKAMYYRPLKMTPVLRFAQTVLSLAADFTELNQPFM